MTLWGRRYLALPLVTALFFLGLPGPASLAAQDPQTSQGSSTSGTPAQTAPSQATGTQAAPPQTSSSQDNTPGDSTPANVDSTAPGTKETSAKSGSEADVDAIGNRKVGHGPDLYSLEHEIALGKQLAQEVDRSAKLIDDPVVTEYVNRVGQNLVRNSDAKVPFTIKVIDSDEVNAFALPGGFFYVNSGLILRADEESELAGVMAHEIAHVGARHGTRNATKGELMQLATIPLIMLGPGGWLGYGIYEGLNFAHSDHLPEILARLPKREADYLGLQYMYKAGYDPNAFVTFFEKIEADEKKHPGTIPKIFSTHPPTPDAHRGFAEGNCHHSSGARGIHRHHFRI